MNKIKTFIKENKALVIGVGVAVVGGVIIYKLTKSKVTVPKHTVASLMEANSAYTLPTVDNLAEAVETFIEYENVSDTVALFFENGRYSVLNLDA